MEKKNYSGFTYDKVREWIDSRRKYGESWDYIKNMKFLPADRRTGEELTRTIQMIYPSCEPVSAEDWKELVLSQEEEEKKRRSIETRGDQSILRSGNELNEATVPESQGSSWQNYRKKLKNNGFSSSSINQIEYQTISILRHMSSDTRDADPKKGLVIGNVQSGKTASMAGLMAMAADNGWNYFVVLTGPTDALRKQTEERLRNDLQHTGKNLMWDYIGYSQMEDKHFDYTVFGDPRRVFFSVCLKNSKRLSTLTRFLERAKANQKSMRILIIDDEADNASINTGDIQDPKKRKAINQKIINLVYGHLKPKEPKAPFRAMNYVSYTATPYANCLNEGPGTDEKPTLYPESFIIGLLPGNGYFGPEMIFGLEGTEDSERMNLVNIIPKEQVESIRRVEEGYTEVLPESLKDSILWFICAAAIQRFNHSLKPVSMLIHTTPKIFRQDALYQAVNIWLNRAGDELIEDCHRVYKEQTEMFTVKDLRRVYPDYEFLDEVSEYPEFDELVSHISTLISEITTIHLDVEEGDEFVFNKGLLLCEDNSSKGADEEGHYYRLTYPDKDTLSRMGYAPAFIVVGGNTLSRGLTLEGLVSSYFLRHSIQADSLMQMGRWFGYRKGYELLPRIWMTEASFRKFQLLADIDNDLRSQLELLSQSGKTPYDFGLALKTSPRSSWLRLTAKNKSQSAREEKLDFSGTDMQLLTYPKDQDVMHRNNELLKDFLKSLGKPQISVVDGVSGIWNGVKYEKIDEEIFRNGFEIPKASKTFQELKPLRNWIHKETDLGNCTDWTVVFGGTRKSDDEKKNFTLSPDFSVGKVKRSWAETDPSRITFKALTGKREYVAHLKEKDFKDVPEEGWSWDKLLSDSHITRNYRQYIQAAHKENTPLLIVYCIDSEHSMERPNANTGAAERRTMAEAGINEDLLGIAMVVPGVRGEHSLRVRLATHENDGEEDED